MRWKVRKKVAPVLGDVRWVMRFAFLPKQVEGCYVWLETYRQQQVYRQHTDQLRFHGGYWSAQAAFLKDHVYTPIESDEH